MTQATLFGAWQAQGLNPLHECHRLVADPPTLNSYRDHQSKKSRSSSAR